MLSSQFLNWAAGFLEGEGSFRFHRNNSGGSTPEVTAVQVQREPLDRLRLSFGGNISWRSNKGRGIHTWQLCGPTAIGLMMSIYGLMSPTRKVRIREAIDAWRAAPGKGIGPKSRMHCPHGHPYDDANTIFRVVTKKNGSAGQLRRCSICLKASWAKIRARQTVERETECISS